MKKPEVRIAITSGDQDGIGPEVTAKALHQMGPKKGVHIFLWRSSSFQKKYLKLIDKKFTRREFTGWHEAMADMHTSYKEVYDIVSEHPPPKWVETVARSAHQGRLNALVTAPLSKTLIAESGMTDVGHTEILARVTEAEELFMTFFGSEFNVLLVTGHHSLKDVPAQLWGGRLERALRSAHSLAKLQARGKKAKPIALVGLNPHAGEQGLIGREELEIFAPVLKKLRAEGLKIEGPLVPDAAFLEQNRKKYSIFVCPYHDQGLIPFKVVHGHKGGCQMSMGLSFIRTSVEHGTAKELFGRDVANSASMQDALKQAILLSQNSFKPDQF